MRTCGIFCFVYMCGPHIVGRSAAQACYYYYYYYYLNVFPDQHVIDDMSYEDLNDAMLVEDDDDNYDILIVIINITTVLLTMH